MPKIKYLSIRFANHILPAEIPCFRAAVIEKTNREAPLFHNHKEDGVIYRYPMIQYKLTKKKASIICLNQGTDEIHYLLRNQNLDLQIGTKKESYEIEDIKMNYFNVQTSNTTFHYSLLNWQALNQKNHKIYHQLESEVERLQLLEKILTGNLLSFAKNINWFLEEKLEVKITKFKQIKALSFKGKKVVVFSLNFSCNISLPDYIGIGKGSSVGFGVVQRIGNGQLAKNNR